MDDRPSMGRSRGRGRGQDVRPGQQVAVPPAGSGTPVAGQVSFNFFFSIMQICFHGIRYKILVKLVV